MALPELVLALERDAQDRLTAVRAEAVAEADRMRTEASRELARRRATDLAARAAELKAAAAGAIDAARRDAALRSLAARAGALETILARARAMLAATVPDAGKEAGIRRNVDAALEYLGSTGAVVRCRPAWAPALRVALAGRANVRLEQSDSVGAGMVVLAGDGGVEIDATIDSRLTRLWPGLAIELMREAESPA
jgi:vacuolar-type H+-ATPase subunit E/Vma4